MSISKFCQCFINTTPICFLTFISTPNLFKYRFVALYEREKKKISIFQIFATTEIKIVTVNTENTKPVMVKLEKKKKKTNYEVS